MRRKRQGEMGELKELGLVLSSVVGCRVKKTRVRLRLVGRVPSGVAVMSKGHD